ncbi:unnamed protein product [Lepeophtheirus salmonis]|uniref:(salmon louse) hypothetical protein n=1 Tax=Lepeophtheirus salmonis TaxID=72036 RepID=A0A7R8CLW7_LEPSM|nr:unnamed protein product [Lepeophtheirus salmonis]CAF2861539.1 unnamed protein product [Lepeophtheirus salmonis]
MKSFVLYTLLLSCCSPVNTIGKKQPPHRHNLQNCRNDVVLIDTPTPRNTGTTPPPLSQKRQGTTHPPPAAQQHLCDTRTYRRPKVPFLFISDRPEKFLYPQRSEKYPQWSLKL